jgi:hypothetical protein
MDLASIIQNSMAMEEENKVVSESEDICCPEPQIDHNEMIKMETVENATENTTDMRHTLVYDLINFKDLLLNNINLQYTKVIDTSNINDFSDEDGIVIFKSLIENNHTIQMYKNMNEYMIFDKSIESMNLFGENGFMIKFQNEDIYHWKAYGTKSTICFALFIEVNDKNYPLYMTKFVRNKVKKIEWNDSFVLLDATSFNAQLYNNDYFDAEDCCVYYSPFYKKMDELTDKQTTINKLHDILDKTYDVAHSMKLINAMINIL